jgi:hypothetical protein
VQRSDPSLRFFHGGVAGLGVGEIITPGHADERHVDGCAICAAHAAGTSTAIDPLTPPDRVYVTTDRDYARYYASRAVLGWLYVVEPLGELTTSHEDQFPSWWCSSARVISIYERAVRLSHAQRRRLFVRWGGNEVEYAAMVRSIGGAHA